MHALHNAHLLRKILPRSISAPIAAFGSDLERRKHHDKWAKQLQVSGPARRDETAKKAAVTRANRKKVASDLQAVEADQVNQRNDMELDASGSGGSATVGQPASLSGGATEDETQFLSIPQTSMWS